MPTKTELIWEGKYDANGKRLAPVRVALPFQTVETVNESAQDRRDLFQLAAQEKPWRNRLIWGDKKYVLPSQRSSGRSLPVVTPSTGLSGRRRFATFRPRRDDA